MKILVILNLPTENGMLLVRIIVKAARKSLVILAFESDESTVEKHLLLVDGKRQIRPDFIFPVKLIKSKELQMSRPSDDLECCEIVAVVKHPSLVIFIR